MRSTPALFAALLLAAVLPAHAQDPYFAGYFKKPKPDSVLAVRPAEGAWHFGIGAGVSMPLADAKTALQDGYNGQVYVAWSPPGLPVGLRFTANADHHVLKGLSPGDIGSGTLIAGLGGFTLGVPYGPIRPYVVVGGGAFYIASEVNGTITGTPKFGVDAGAGLQLKVGSFGAFVEGRLQNLFNPPQYGPTGTDRTLQQMEAQIIPVTVGFFW